jgi:hypothetical protein
MTGCQGDENTNVGTQDSGTRKDATDAVRQPDAAPESPPSDPRLPSEPSNEQADGRAADGGVDTAPADRQDVPVGLDGERPDELDGWSPPWDASDDGVDAPAVDARADNAQNDLPLDDRSGIDVGPVCAEGMTQSCASPDNPLVGACHAGVHVCTGGVWGPCSEVLPAASESCNGIDDNCNGLIDEGCAAGCIVVCGKCTGTEAGAADGSVDHPFATIEEALATTGPVDGGTHRRICVVGGATCKESTLYPTTGPLRMTDGLIIQGSYAITENGLEYCGVSAVRPKTTLTLASSEGVVFDETIRAGAELSSLVIEINPTSGSEPAAATVAAIAVKGAKNVSLSRVFVSDGFAAANTRGVAITAGGQATITGSSISTGQGRTSAVGVYVNGGAVNLRNNCDRIVGGKCASYCDDGGSMLGFHVYKTASTADAPSQASAVFITGSASSLVGNMICGGTSNLADGQSVATVGALRCEDAGCATVSGNVMAGGDDRDVVTVALVGADPLLDGNLIEAGCGDRTTTTTVVRLESSSARLQNNRILGGQCAGAGSPEFRGLHLVSSGTSDSPDVHSNDIEPLGLAADCQSIGILVEGAAGGGSTSGGVFRNNIISAGVCDRRFAISEATGATLQSLQNNNLYGPSREPPASGLILYHHGETNATTAVEVNAIALAKGNLSADPQYASYPKDLHLTAQSPCIDQGTSDGAPGSDVDGNARPAGGGYDIGAYELAR